MTVDGYQRIPQSDPWQRHNDSPTPTNSPELAWYEGGPLHAVNSQTWHSATRRNRLATSADWVVRWVLREKDGTVPSVSAAQGVAQYRQSDPPEQVEEYLDTLRLAAVELMTCVDEAVSGDEVISSTAGVAVACLIMVSAESN